MVAYTISYTCYCDKHSSVTYRRRNTRPNYDSNDAAVFNHSMAPYISYIPWWNPQVVDPVNRTWLLCIIQIAGTCGKIITRFVVNFNNLIIWKWVSALNMWHYRNCAWYHVLLFIVVMELKFWRCTQEPVLSSFIKLLYEQQVAGCCQTAATPESIHVWINGWYDV